MMRVMNEMTSMHGQCLSLALIGGGGAGVMTAGEVLLDAAARAGWYGLMTRSTGPQIRGGEAAAIIRLGSEPVDCQDDRLDLLIALDFNQAERFAPELVLDHRTLVLADFETGSAPEWITASSAALVTIPFHALVRNHRGVRVNSIALGLAGCWLALPDNCIDRALRARFERLGEKVVDASLAGVRLGRESAQDLAPAPCTRAADHPAPRWMITGNQATALGALQGGVRFCAAYPITPSTEIQEWLAGHLPQVGGQLVQAEDELASINLCIGASFGGVPSFTATAGPGLSLMVEALGLASMTEIPLVVANVMRGGPSTGIPTRPEQSDLNLAVYGAHGDAPRLVVAPISVADCQTTTAWAVEQAEALQCPAIVLSDQFLAQSLVIIRQPVSLDISPPRRKTAAVGSSTARYAAGADHVAPMPIPGTPGLAWTATGLSHDDTARPSSQARDHQAHLERRQAKLESITRDLRWADIDGDGPVNLLTWGSISAACGEACQRWRDQGHAVRLISLRLISPLPDVSLSRILVGCEGLLVVEQSHSGQFFHYLKSRLTLPQNTRRLARPGPLALRPGEVLEALEKLISKREAA